MEAAPCWGRSPRLQSGSVGKILTAEGTEGEQKAKEEFSVLDAPLEKKTLI